MKKARKKFGCAVHGAGWVSTEHIRAYMLNPHCRVVALSSRTREGMRGRCRRGTAPRGMGGILR